MSPHYHALPKKPPPAVLFIVGASAALWSCLWLIVVNL